MSELMGPILGLFVLLTLSGFFSSSETALMAVSRFRVRQLERLGDRRATVVHGLIARPDRLLSAILLGNNFVNVAASALATTVALQVAGPQGVVVATLLMTALILIFSEIAPKTYAARHPERLALAVARPVQATVTLLQPLGGAAAWIADVLLRPLGGQRAEGQTFSEEDIRGIVELGGEERVLERSKRRMLRGVFHLTETTIEDIMIPRTRASVVAMDSDPIEMIRLVRESGHTRVPVCRGSLDDVVGILHAKDILRYWDRPAELDVESVLRKPIFVPETASLEALLQLFRDQRQHLALVIDEFGGVEGIVTLEDLLEEIVGEIADEHDPIERPGWFELGDGSLLVEGGCSLSDLARKYEPELRSRSSSTVAGFLMEIAGDVPELGDRIDHEELAFRVVRATSNRIDMVRIEGFKRRKTD